MSDSERLRPIVLGPGEGRAYALGAMSAVFKADEAETAATLFHLGMVPGAPQRGPRAA